MPRPTAHTLSALSRWSALAILLALVLTTGARADDAAHRQALDAAFARQDPAAAAAYLKANGKEMQKTSPDLFRLYQLQTLMWQSRIPEARAYHAEILAEKPELAEDDAFKRLSEALDAFPDMPPKLLVDYELDGNKRAVLQLSRDGQKLALYRRIRETMEASSDHLLLSPDPDLFTGAANAYRAAFTEHQAGYDAYLTDYLTGLAQATELTPTAQAALYRRLSLAPSPARPPAAADDGPATLPKRLDAPVQIGDLLDGATELAHAEDAPDKRLRDPALGAPVWTGDLLAMQTSRELIATRDGAVIWSLRLDPTYIDFEGRLGGERHPWRTMPLTPAANADNVVARLITDGEFHLIALNAADGSQRWEVWPDTYDFCGDPIIWQDHVFVVARKHVTPVEYHLLALDLSTGQVQASYFLYSAEPLTGYYAPNAHRIELDRFMPAITVADDTAYIGSNAGIVMAFDLSRRATLWARSYARPHYQLAAGLAAIPMQRDASPAIVSGDTVLVAPIDSLQLLALNRHTGEIVTADATMTWSAVRAVAGGRALVRSHDGKRLTVVTIADLQTVAELQSETPWHWASDADGRAILQRGDEIGRLTGGATPAFAAAGRVPTGTRVLTANADRLVVSQRLPDGFAILATAATPATPQLRPPSQEMVDGAFTTIGGHRYVVGSNAIVRLAPDLTPVWSCGVPVRPRFIVPDGDDLMVVFDHRIWGVDGATGRVRHSYPESDRAWPTFSTAAPGPDGPLFAVVAAGDTCHVMRWNHGSPTLLGTLTWADSVAAILRGGEAVVGIKHSRGTPYTLDAATGIYAKLSDEGHWIDIYFHGGYGYTLADGSFVFANDYQEAVAFDGKTVSRIDLKRKGTLSSHSHSYYWSHDVVRTSIWDTKSPLYVVDLRHKRDLTMELFAARRPYVDDRYIVGFTSGRKREIEGWSYDRESGKKAPILDTLQNSTNDKRVTERHHQPTDFTLRVGDTVYTSYGPKGDSPGRLERGLVVQDVETGAGDTSYLPGFLDGTDAVATDTHVMIACNNRLVRLTTERFRELATGTIAVPGTVDRSFSITPDGFLDEWPTTGVTTIGTNRLQVIATLQTVHVALDIRDPALIKRLCEPGALESLHLVFGPGDGLVTSMDMARRGRSLRSPVLSPPTPSFQAGVSVSPAADRLIIEAVYTSNEADEGVGRPQKWNRIFIGRTSAPSRLGDLAVDLLLASPDGRTYTSLLTPDDPTGAPRFILNKR